MILTNLFKKFYTEYTIGLKFERSVWIIESTEAQYVNI